MTEPIRIDGLKEFNKNLKKLNSDLPKATRLALNEAADIVVSGAKPKVPTRTGRARRTLKAASTRTKSRVSAGSKRASYYPWLDFGGRVGRKHSVKRTYKKQGRYIYPTYRKAKQSGKFQQVLSDSLIKVAKSAGVEIE